MLKVCIFTETYYPVMGGGETQSRLLAHELDAAGIKVSVLTRRSDAALPRSEDIEGIPVYRLPPVGRGQLKKWGLLFSSAPKLIQLRREYDLIFVSGFRIIGLTAVLVAKLLGKRVVLKADSQGEMSGKFFEDGLARIGMTPSTLPFRWFLSLRNSILKKAAAFSAITKDAVGELEGAGVKRDAIHLIPNGVDARRFHPVSTIEKQALRAKLGLALEQRIIIYSGRLVSYKGLPLLLRVWRELRQHRDDISLVLLGTGGLDIHNCEAELKAFAVEHDLLTTVHFMGSVDNVQEYLQASDIYTLPTENDAFPSSLVEAMMCKLPVVTTPIGAIPQIIKDGQSGLLVQPGSFRELHDALNLLLEDSSLVTALGENGWVTAKQWYSSEIVGEQYIQLFHSVTNTQEVGVGTEVADYQKESSR